MILKDIVYTVWRELEGGYIPDDTRFNYKNIRTVVLGCIGESALDLAMKTRNLNPDDPYPAYYNEYESEVKFDDRSNNHYAEIKGRPFTFNGVRSYDVSFSENSYNAMAVDFVPTSHSEWFNLKRLPRVPNVIHYLSGVNRLNFLADMKEGDSVMISQSFSVPLVGDENEDNKTNIPDEIGRSVITNTLIILRDELRPSDRANDGVPTN